MTAGGLGTVYSLGSAEDAQSFYDGWADGYEDELTAAGYITPRRCAEALAGCVDDRTRPLLEIGCGTGLGGLALRAAGFETLDGFDISEAMLEKARAKDIYASLGTIDLSAPLDALPEDRYANAAAIGVLNPSFMPPTVIDEVLARLPPGGCFVFSINDNSARDGSFETRVLELTEHNVADLVFKDYGDHIPEEDLKGTVYVLKKR